MWRVRIAVAGLAVSAAAAVASGAGTAASAEAGRLSLIVTTGERGWIALAVSGPQTGTVDVREVTRGAGAVVARLSLRGGDATRDRAVRWRCEVRTRRFAATLRGGSGEAATAAITTPSCADRLRMIVVPSRLRPGEAARVRVSDTWRFGGIAASLCARPDGGATRCERLRLPPGARMARSDVTLRAPGHRTIVLRSQYGQRLDAQIQVRDDARLRVLVTGDSMVYGLFEGLGVDLGPRASVIGDPHPGRGITTPGGYLDWPAHARRSARSDKPDVTVVFLGYADAGYPLVAASGETVACCDADWVAAYASRVRAMMASYLRDGRGLVYWLALPAPRSPGKALVTLAENEAVRLAGRDFDDGVQVIGRAADILSPQGLYQEAISIDGSREVVRAADGVHLTAPGIGIVTGVLREALRGDGLLPAAR